MNSVLKYILQIPVSILKVLSAKSKLLHWHAKKHPSNQHVCQISAS